MNRAACHRTLERLCRRGTRIRDLFDADSVRGARFSLEAVGMLLDYAKTSIDDEVLAALLELARATGVESARDSMLAGEEVNQSEQRPALHTALRRHRTAPLRIADHDIVADIRTTHARLERMAVGVRSGAVKPAAASRFRHVINVGIGGSSLGPEMAIRALATANCVPDIHFLSNVDGRQADRLMQGLDPAATLVIIVSKTFTTIETMTNARTLRDWIAGTPGGEAAVGSQFLAVTACPERARSFGIEPEFIYGFGSYVGGRYSLWGPVGASIMIAIGARAFAQFLAGAEAMDDHFARAELSVNMPVLLALTGLWHSAYCRLPTRAIIPYDQSLARLPAYLQQLEMESNGKSVDQAGAPVTAPTCPVVWGETGTDAQHAFFQLLHQGTQVVPCEFLIAARGAASLAHHHDLLMANCVAQSEALMVGRSTGDAHRDCPGDKPSTTLAYPCLDPFTLGAILALYEHRVFVEATLHGINCFDQWGVELGKALATDLLPSFTDRCPPHRVSSSTRGLFDYLMRNAGERPPS